jgi:hypothetical protein
VVQEWCCSTFRHVQVNQGTLHAESDPAEKVITRTVVQEQPCLSFRRLQRGDGDVSSQVCERVPVNQGYPVMIQHIQVSSLGR